MIGSFEARFFCAMDKRGSHRKLHVAVDSGGPLDQILADGPNGRLGAVGDADLAQNVLDVLLHRLVADSQRLGDFFVRQAERELLEDFALALGEWDVAIGTIARGGQCAGDAAQFFA